MRVLLFLSIVALGAGVAGCGQSGPLYLPPPEQEKEKGSD